MLTSLPASRTFCGSITSLPSTSVDTLLPVFSSNSRIIRSEISKFSAAVLRASSCASFTRSSVASSALPTLLRLASISFSVCLAACFAPFASLRLAATGSMMPLTAGSVSVNSLAAPTMSAIVSANSAGVSAGLYLPIAAVSANALNTVGDISLILVNAHSAPSVPAAPMYSISVPNLARPLPVMVPLSTASARAFSIKPA